MNNKKIIIALLLLTNVFTWKLTQTEDDKCFEIKEVKMMTYTSSQWWSNFGLIVSMENTCLKPILLSSTFKITAEGIKLGGSNVTSADIGVVGSPYLDNSVELNGDKIIVSLRNNGGSWQLIGSKSKYNIEIKFGGSESQFTYDKVYTSSIPAKPTASLNVKVSSIPSNISVDYTLEYKEKNIIINGVLNQANNTIKQEKIDYPSTYLLKIKGIVSDSIIYSPISKTINITEASIYKLDLSFSKNTQASTYNFRLTGYTDSTPIKAVLKSSNYVYDALSITSSTQSFSLPKDENIEATFDTPRNWSVSPQSAFINPLPISVDLTFTKQEAPKEGLKIGAYYQTWSSAWTSNPNNLSLSNLPNYMNRVFLSFVKPDTDYTEGRKSFTNTGLEFSSDFSVVKEAITILKSKNSSVKVLLSVGGATFHNFDKINVNGLVALAKDLGADGIDIDYEVAPGCTGVDTDSLKCNADDAIISITRQLKSAMPSSMLLTIASFSVGAYGTKKFPTTKGTPSSSNSGMNVNSMKAIGNLLDEVYIMSYDASDAYDPKYAFDAYADLVDKSKLFIGLETPPEAWGGHVLKVDEAIGYAKYVRDNGGAGVFLWAIQKSPAVGQTYLQAICEVYGLKECSKALPSN